MYSLGCAAFVVKEDFKYLHVLSCYNECLKEEGPVVFQIKATFPGFCTQNYYFTLDFFPVVENSLEITSFINTRMFVCPEAEKQVTDYWRTGLQKPL